MDCTGYKREVLKVLNQNPPAPWHYLKDVSFFALRSGVLHPRDISGYKFANDREIVLEAIRNNRYAYYFGCGRERYNDGKLSLQPSNMARGYCKMLLFS
jgi:hypothetical protein